MARVTVDQAAILEKRAALIEAKEITIFNSDASSPGQGAHARPGTIDTRHIQKCIVFYSGGASSWAAGKLAVAKYGAERTTLLFTDTLIEDSDLYRFLSEGASNIGAPLVRIQEGRTPWQVFHDVQMMGNSRVDPCSRVLKREPAKRWIDANCDPATTSLVFGIDFTESHRFDNGGGRGVRPRYAVAGWPHVEAICTLSPVLAPWDVMAWLAREGIKRPRLYDLGFAHNNCGGACVKAGKGAWAHTLKVLPDVFAEWEREEAQFNASRPNKRPQAILRDEVVGKPTTPLTLANFRARIESQRSINFDDIGGCGCFLEADNEVAA